MGLIATLNLLAAQNLPPARSAKSCENSPKVAEHAIRLSRCDELKYVRCYGQSLPRPALKDVKYKLISPAFSGGALDSKTLHWCISLVKDNPEWRLSVQQHNLWKIL